MKRIVLLLAALPFLASAQAPDVLLEACNAMPDAAKRMECLKAAIGSNQTSGKQDALESIVRAFGNMQASLDVGISYNNYQIALLDLAKSVAAYKQDAGSTGKAAAGLFNASVEAYRDAGTFWERSISFYAKRDNNLAYSGGLPVSMNGLDWLVNKYRLSMTKSDIWGLERGLPVQSTRAEIWRIAKVKADQGFQAAKNPPADGVSAQLWLPYDMTGESPERPIAEKIAKGSACHSSPILSLVLDAEERKGFKVQCEDRSTLYIVCSAGMCRGTLE